MGSSRAADVEALVWEVRRSFQLLAAAADRELEGLGIRARDRAFLEFLVREQQPVSLSAIAQKFSVSRQHIHQTFKALSHPEWVEQVPDPHDRRTVLLRLSRRGRAMWEKIRALDQASFQRLGGRLDPEQVSSATSLLKELRRQAGRQGG